MISSDFVEVGAGTEALSTSVAKMDTCSQDLYCSFDLRSSWHLTKLSRLAGISPKIRFVCFCCPGHAQRLDRYVTYISALKHASYDFWRHKLRCMP